MNKKILRTELCRFMEFKLVEHISPIVVTKIFKKPNCNIYIESHLNIFKNYIINVPHLQKNQIYIWRAIKRLISIGFD